MPNMKVRFLQNKQWPIPPFSKECPIVKSNKLYHGSNYSIMTRKFLLNEDDKLNVIIASSTISTPITLPAFFAIESVIVPTPQYRSKTVSSSLKLAYSIALA